MMSDACVRTVYIICVMPSGDAIDFVLSICYNCFQ